MNLVHIDLEDAQAIAQNIQEHIQYDSDDDAEFWQEILTRLNTSIRHATSDWIMKLTNKQKEFIRWYVATDISAEMFERIGDCKELQDDNGEVPDEVWDYINSLGDRVYAFFNYPTREY